MTRLEKIAQAERFQEFERDVSKSKRQLDWRFLSWMFPALVTAYFGAGPVRVAGVHERGSHD